LRNELRAWRSETIKPVMVSSATDPYQPAELRYGLTRKCIEVLQEYNVPYYIFTKSTIISRDLLLHQRYKQNCFLVWSITTCNEKIRRIIEPGTAPAYQMSSVIRKFTDAGITCGVNIDPILPFITDSEEEIDAILDNCNRSGVGYVFGALLRLRADIWERMQIILKLLGINDGIEVYKKRVYRFTEPLNPSYNIAADDSYSNKILQNLESKVLERRMIFDFPAFIGERHIKASKKSQNHGANKNDNGQQITLMTYM
jgi:DNA repair photolyase